MRRKQIPAVALPFILMAMILVSSSGCAPRWKTIPPYQGKQKPKPAITTTVKKMGYTIQVGAFSKVENAVRLSKALEGQGLDSFYFPHKSGLYKVRFGNYTSLAKAQAVAVSLQQKGIIGEYYLVRPSEYTISAGSMIAGGGDELRDELVKTAYTYIGVPYEWGACTISGPVDCSGLVMAVYQLNGLSVPRTSEEQYQYGMPVSKDDLSRGDLVFFDTNGGGKVSHVGIYIGDGRFIHAPGKGKTICEESLSRTFYVERYIGACTYLR